MKSRPHMGPETTPNCLTLAPASSGGPPTTSQLPEPTPHQYSFIGLFIVLHSIPSHNTIYRLVCQMPIHFTAHARLHSRSATGFLFKYSLKLYPAQCVFFVCILVSHPRYYITTGGVGVDKENHSLPEKASSRKM